MSFSNLELAIYYSSELISCKFNSRYPYLHLLQLLIIKDISLKLNEIVRDNLLQFFLIMTEDDFLDWQNDSNGDDRDTYFKEFIDSQDEDASAGNGNHVEYITCNTIMRSLLK